MIDTLAQRTEIRPFKASDLVWIMAEGVKEFGLRFLPDEQIDELAQTREDNGKCITGLVDGVIVGCGGIDLMWPGTGEVWLFLSYEVDRFPLRSYEVIQQGLEELIERNKLRRIQAWGRVGFHQAHTLFRHLGFKAEGLAREYCPDGADAILYARINRNVRVDRLIQ